MVLFFMHSAVAGLESVNLKLFLVTASLWNYPEMLLLLLRTRLGIWDLGRDLGKICITHPPTSALTQPLAYQYSRVLAATFNTGSD